MIIIKYSPAFLLNETLILFFWGSGRRTEGSTALGSSTLHRRSPSELAASSLPSKLLAQRWALSPVAETSLLTCTSWSSAGSTLSESGISSSNPFLTHLTRSGTFMEVEEEEAGTLRRRRRRPKVTRAAGTCEPWSSDAAVDERRGNERGRTKRDTIFWLVCLTSCLRSLCLWFCADGSDVFGTGYGSIWKSLLNCLFVQIGLQYDDITEIETRKPF